MSALEASPARPLHHTPQAVHNLPHCLEIEVDAGVEALSRVVNLMTKLGIEPAHFASHYLRYQNALRILIDLGTDRDSSTKLMLRLEGMVCVRQVTVRADLST